ncbi:hypothetical protein LX36DRAFT_174561 [Colletotrichum falcatum]|nr:hypothetical protein LX36DRAFT_174561 [Colletotrichum falcatum]
MFFRQIPSALKHCLAIAASGTAAVASSAVGGRSQNVPTTVDAAGAGFRVLSVRLLRRVLPSVNVRHEPSVLRWLCPWSWTPRRRKGVSVSTLNLRFHRHRRTALGLTSPPTHMFLFLPAPVLSPYPPLTSPFSLSPGSEYIRLGFGTV